MPPSPPPGRRRAALAFIFVTVVLDMLALGMVVPVLPRLIEDFLGGDTAGAAMMYGVFGTVWALMQFLSMPIAGALSDRYGRRPVVLASNFGLGLDYVLMALAPNLAWLFVGRVISGITAASTAMAYIADVTPSERRAGAFGMIGVAFGVGFVLGTGDRRIARQRRPASAVLGRSCVQHGERVLRTVGASRVAAA